MNVHPGPIGVFDSGVGGLSVVGEIRRLMPDLDLLYAADSRYCPYGARSEDEVRERTLLVGAELVARGVRLLVVACNTATAAALDDLRARLPVPIVGLEPAIKPAVALSRSGRIGVLATPRTAASARLARLIQNHARGVSVSVVPASGLVELVEGGTLDGPEVESAVRHVLNPVIDDGADTIVLGCTHFPFLRPAMERVAGQRVVFVDSGVAIARRTKALLRPGDLTGHRSGSIRLLTSGDPRQAAFVASRLLGQPVHAEHLPV